MRTANTFEMEHGLERGTFFQGDRGISRILLQRKGVKNTI